MAILGIGGTFTVSTVEDGESAPYYFQEWFAWSNDASTSNVTTPPTIGGSWATSIPAQGSYAYLWRKSIRYVWNENTRQYSGEAAQYVRMSGTNGTSINTKGTIKVAITASGTFPTAGFSSGDLGIKQGDSYIWKFNGSSWSHVSSASSDGDSYTMTKDCTIDLDGDGTPENIKGHLIQWSTEASKWIDLGQFKGESGVTYYTHIAWATNVTISDSTVTVTGFVPTKSPNDTTHIWMGTYVDTNSGQDSANASLYTWSNTKGNKGDDGKNAGEVILTPTTIFFNGDEGRYVYDVEYIQVGVGMKVDGQSCVIGNISVGNTPVGISYTLSGTTITFRNTSSDYGDIEGSVSIVVTGTITSGSVTTTYIATGVLSIVCTQAGEQGETGQRGKIGRFCYFGGTFNAADTTQTFIVNDAQAPYFEHTENGQKRYHVFNYDTNGSYTMAQMWAISSNWNNAPWEVMTNDFKYIITEAIFAQFAHLGSFIISGDYFISQYGTLFYNNNGTIETTVIDASNVSTLFGGSVAYAWFADSDPMVNTMPTTGNYKFRPMKCINALTGEEWMAEGKVHVDADGNVEVTGVIRATTLYQSFIDYNPLWGSGQYVTEISASELLSDIGGTLPNILWISSRDVESHREDLYTAFEIHLPNPSLYDGHQIEIICSKRAHYTSPNGDESWNPGIYLHLPDSSGHDTIVWSNVQEAESELNILNYQIRLVSVMKNHVQKWFVLDFRDCEFTYQ